MATVTINGVTISGSSVNIPASFPATITWSGNAEPGITLHPTYPSDVKMKVTQNGTTYGPWYDINIDASSQGAWGPGGASGTATLSDPSSNLVGQTGAITIPPTLDLITINWVNPVTRCTTYLCFPVGYDQHRR